MTNSFSPSRFCAYTKAELFLHRKTIISVIGIFVAFCALYYILPAFMIGNLDIAMRPDLVGTVQLGAVVMAIYSSMAFKVFRKPGGGTFAMQMPVATCEKFTLRAIAHVIIIPLLVALLPRLTWSAVSCFSSIFDQDFNSYRKFWEGLTMLLVFQSTIFLGSVVFRKNPLIKVLISWALFGILMASFIEFNKRVLGITWNEFKPLFDFMHTWSYELTAVFVVVFVALAWAKFRKFQIIK